mmetsp:Transcript_29791/g.79555  ORF Transcript_29791/g.79555 Transcript_29791/m.79555 type:complete len:272 (+) Transcript_29791:74-889(+)|eukprot:CAMPEP_0119512712 /NCGR_PEP_ID=MMETSP1344-20130328/31019_1 /TAXON_ID=236787 /ORGANISM="Florenciella parvula, Strain CCMP2471" /LENGTH=271 /DNA_ID=CAMNT_0007549861 /DNA_START=57 /DNA_END=872 /DNA_ORIENTATION=-
MSGPVKVALGIVAVAGAALVVSGMLKKEEKVDSCDMTQEEVVTIFKKIKGTLQGKMSSIMKNIEMLKQQVPDPAQLQMIILMEFEKQLTAIQEAVFEEFKCDEEDLETATNYYLARGDEEVKASVEALRELYAMFGGKVDTEVPAELTVEKMCDILEMYMDTITKANQEIQNIVTHMQMSGQQMTPEMEEPLKKMVETETNKVFSKFGINTMIFQAACEKYNKHPKFIAKANEMDQKRKMAAAGAGAMSPTGMAAPPAAPATPAADDGELD